MNTNDVFSLAYPNYYRLTFNQYKHCWDVILFNTGASCVCLCVHMHIQVYFYTSTWTLLWLFMCSPEDNIGVCHLPFLETRLLTEPVISWAGQAGWPVSLSESTCLCLPSARDYKCTPPMPVIFMWVLGIQLKPLWFISWAISSPYPIHIKSQFQIVVF